MYTLFIFMLIKLLFTPILPSKLTQVSHGLLKISSNYVFATSYEQNSLYISLIINHIHPIKNRYYELARTT
ncbi:MAG TPA: hypothetical protein VI413_00700, partial [Paludibacter sp.]